MRIGVLGTDRWADGVAAAAAARGSALVTIPEGSDDGAWERFLDPDFCDAIVVGTDGWKAGRAEAVRSLVQAGRPLVVTQPLELSMLWAWEIEMIRQDGGGVIVPILAARLHPFIARLRNVVETAMAGGGTLGTIESIELERRLPDRKRQAVLDHLARDVDLVRVIAGEPERLAAFGVAADADVWNALTVGFTGQSLIPVRWQVSAATEGSLTIAVRAAGGTLSVDIPEDWHRAWTWSDATQRDALTATFSPADAVLDVLVAALRESTRTVANEAVVPRATWADAARGIELAETVPRSLAKGRAIDLHREEFSELGTFRGTMASLGCGLILAALLLVVSAAILGGIANAIGWDLGERVAGTWPIVALVVLGGFLVLQFLPAIVASRPGHEEKS